MALVQHVAPAPCESPDSSNSFQKPKGNTMRTQINVDSATPAEVYHLTLALQRVHPAEGEPTVPTSEPTVTVAGSAMGWASPYMSRQRAAAVLREFDRLEAGLFDEGYRPVTGVTNDPSAPLGLNLREVMEAGPWNEDGTHVDANDEPEAVDPLAGDSEKVDVKYTATYTEEDPEFPWEVLSHVEVNGERVGDPTHIVGFASQEGADREVLRLTKNLPTQ